MLKLLPSVSDVELEELFKFSKIKLIVLDLDGTTVKHNACVISKLISELNIKLKHRRYGVNITIATGRTISGAEPLINSLALDRNIPIILYNGSVIARPYDYKILEKKTIDTVSARQVVESSLISNSASIYAYIVKDGVFPAVNSSSEQVFGWTKGLQEHTDVNGMEIIWQNNFDSLDNLKPCAILIHEPVVENKKNTLSMLNAIVGISCTTSSSSFIEVRPCNSNKATALQALSTISSIKKEEILAVGDNDNDAEMLKWAGIGMSVANASPLALESSDYVSLHGVAEGAVEALRLVRSSRYYFYNPKAKRD